jgi:hypothetical protein
MKPRTAIERLYRLSLRLYPACFHREFGDDVVQLARDQWREQTTVSGRIAFICKILGDLTSSLVKQHIEKQRRVMKNMPKNKLSVGLAVLAVAVTFFGLFAGHLGAWVAAIVIIISGILLMARVYAEWQRARSEWVRGLMVTILMLLAFSILMPAWGKVQMSHGSNISPQLGMIMVIPLLLNLAVAVVNPFAKAR